MGNRFWLGMGVLGGLLALGLLVTAGMGAVHEPAAREFQQAAETALTGDMTGAVEQARSARQRWRQGQRFTACVADHTPMDEVEHLLAEMEVFALAGDAEHFAACCARLSAALQAMSEAHSPAWWNLL